MIWLKLFLVRIMLVSEILFSHIIFLILNNINNIIVILYNNNNINNIILILYNNNIIIII